MTSCVKLISIPELCHLDKFIQDKRIMADATGICYTQSGNVKRYEWLNYERSESPYPRCCAFVRSNIFYNSNSTTVNKYEYWPLNFDYGNDTKYNKLESNNDIPEEHCISITSNPNTYQPIQYTTNSFFNRSKLSNQKFSYRLTEVFNCPAYIAIHSRLSFPTYLFFEEKNGKISYNLGWADREYRYIDTIKLEGSAKNEFLKLITLNTSKDLSYIPNYAPYIKDGELYTLSLSWCPDGSMPSEYHKYCDKTHDITHIPDIITFVNYLPRSYTFMPSSNATTIFIDYLTAPKSTSANSVTYYLYVYTFPSKLIVNDVDTNINPTSSIQRKSITVSKDKTYYDFTCYYSDLSTTNEKYKHFQVRYFFKKTYYRNSTTSDYLSTMTGQKLISESSISTNMPPTTANNNMCSILALPAYKIVLFFVDTNGSYLDNIDISKFGYLRSISDSCDVEREIYMDDNQARCFLFKASTGMYEDFIDKATNFHFTQIPSNYTKYNFTAISLNKLKSFINNSFNIKNMTTENGTLDILYTQNDMIQRKQPINNVYKDFCSGSEDIPAILVCRIA